MAPLRVAAGLVALALAGAAAGAAGAADPGAPAGMTPDDYRQIQRELRIGADVLRASLADGLPDSRRVIDVDAGYLAGQGVLVLVDVANPWFRLDRDQLDIDPEITRLEQIPDMVQEILSELNFGLSRHQTEELQELREIRGRQRALRAEQRALRAEIRTLRRQLQQADQHTPAIEQAIARLEANLAALDDEERALEEDAVAVRESLRVPPRHEDAAQPGGLDRAVAEAVCAYGATFKSLGGGQRLNVLVRQPQGARYYVFQMSDVRECQAGESTAEALLTESFAYDGGR